MSRSISELIPQYGLHKDELDSLKKIVDEENKSIKSLLKQSGEVSKESDGWAVKLIVQKRESMNEAKLLEIAHQFGIPEIVKTKEYIDFDALEKAIYDHKISTEVLVEMDKAKEVKEVETLRISKLKK